ncbi:hypothetical protein [Thalassoroseus pseudoceratinae]|uniref:hypothetical protein n=1 Tax=Thalassoroseus pseudoceratinae TaxID=2713176 RepID=UPI00142470A2|nr:hypothetical protein [Thalassoroseus pseudoceratinae]
MYSQCVTGWRVGRVLVAESRRWLFVGGFLLLTVFAGCGSSESDRPELHGGHFIELPGHEDMQLEFAIDEKERKLIVHVLETGTKKPLPISSQTLEISFQVDGEDVPVSLAADPRPDDPSGRSSRFAISSADLPSSLHNVAHFTAKFTLEVEGKAVSGTLDHKDDHTHHHD